MQETARYVSETVAVAWSSHRGGYARSEFSSGELYRAGADAGSGGYAAANRHASTDCHGDSTPDGHPVADEDSGASHADVHTGSDRDSVAYEYAGADGGANCYAHARGDGNAYSVAHTRAYCAAHTRVHYSACTRAYHSADGNAYYTTHADAHYAAHTNS